ncbi:peroxisomal membrane protein 11A-like isoform X3 [Gopherus flavomarginatus]|uniref:peroxisomal membrane protein 11A-like isoform X3 n=1 Tax=Gopherus flavomarginatus TaxID=286002 RepID=UPI0021CBD24C|nr:peroxisomal membrane protein 11A-like isoform X3 [Gopherus flavomarginatus]
MEAFVNFTNQTQGRDRLFRAIQYTCMLLSYLLERKADKETVIMKLKKLESSMRSGRKLFRLGNMVHAMVAARRTTQLPDLVPRVCLTASHLNRVLYFICDTVLWVKSVGLIPAVDKQKWQNWATKCYYYSLLMSLTRDLYEISWRMEQEAQREKARKENSSHCGEQDQDLFSFHAGLCAEEVAEGGISKDALPMCAAGLQTFPLRSTGKGEAQPHSSRLK